MDEFMSVRGKVPRDWKDDFFEEKAFLFNNYCFHETNKSGYIDVGTEVSDLHKDIVKQKLDDLWICDFDLLGYKDYETGTFKLRQAMAKFMTEFLESHEPVSPANLVCLSGVTSCLDMLCHCLADPGEFFLVPIPMYGRTYKDCVQRSLVDLYPVHVITEDDKSEHPSLTIEKIVCAYEMAIRADQTVRGILLLNPNNPLGDIYSSELLMEIMLFCQEKTLHLIVDEIFALSVFSTSEKFHSILNFPQLPDADRTHIIYGLSKDFGIPGLQIGVIHTKCEQLQKSLKNLSCFQTIPYPVMEIAAGFLDDLDWCRNYIRKYRKTLAEHHRYCATYLREIGLNVRACGAGHSLWIDLRHLCGSSFEGEKKLCSYLLNSARLYLCPGEELFCVQPGWFRMTVAQNSYRLLVALNRLKEALSAYKP